jgi:hypothetical protein
MNEANGLVGKKDKLNCTTQINNKKTSQNDASHCSEEAEKAPLLNNK